MPMVVAGPVAGALVTAIGILFRAWQASVKQVADIAIRFATASEAANIRSERYERAAEDRSKLLASIDRRLEKLGG